MRPRISSFDFGPLPELSSGCDRTIHCKSEGSHYEKCPKLAADLVKFKARYKERAKCFG
jgi:hypothetical protein